MFGQSTAKTPFGGSTFGTGTAFGTQPTTPFGQSSTGGLFGSKTPAAGTFGTPSFGTQTNAFGSSSTTGGLFGVQPSTSTGLFGQQSGAFTFNQNTQPSTGLFGSSNVFKTPQSTNVFGQTSTGFGGFGTTATTQSGSTGLFGSPFASSTATTSTGGGLFGGTSAFGATASSGTTVKFDPISSQEQIQKNGITMTIKGVFQCITAMSAYESKSIEELRLEDYTAGRKGGTSGTTTGLFGASKPATGLFGSTAGTFGQTIGFGQTQAGGTNLFGTSQAAPAQTGGLFGSKPLGTGSLFGSTATPAATSGFSGFGTQSTGGLFGQTNTGLTGGLFGAASSGTSTGLFGTAATTTQSTGLFGTNTLGQQQQAGGLFGASKPFSFNTATTGTGLTLGGTTTGLFGNAAAITKPAFSFNTGTSAFGTSAGLGGGLFGNTASTGLFGQNKTGLGGTFGSTLGTGLGTGALGTGFGASAGLGLGTAQTLGTGIDQNSLALQQQQQLLQTQLKALASSPFGDSPLFRNIKAPTSSSSATDATVGDLHKNKNASSSQYKVFSKQMARPSWHSVASPSYARSKLFEGLEDDTDISSPVLVPRRSVKKLVIKQNHEQTNKSQLSISMKMTSHDDDNGKEENVSVVNELLSEDPDVLNDNATYRGPKQQSNGMASKGDFLDNTMELLGSRAKRSGQSETANDSSNEADGSTSNACGIVLTRPEYYTVPSMDELNATCDKQTGVCLAKNFKVGRRGYGHVVFFGETNVFGINLDLIVSFRRCEIEVYPENYPNKPDVGQELNKKAEISLENVWPTDKSSQTPIKSPKRLKSSGFLERLEQKTTEMDARFIDYQPDGGVWVFQVDHFTKYGLFEQLTAEPNDSPKKSSVGQALTIDPHLKLRKLLEKEKAQANASVEMAHAATETMDFTDQEPLVPQIVDHDSFQSDEDEEMVNDGYSSYHHARGLGLNASRVHEMKASFFDEGHDDFDIMPSSSMVHSRESINTTKQLFGSDVLSDGNQTFASRRAEVLSSRDLLLKKLGADSLPVSPVKSVLASKKRLAKELSEVGRFVSSPAREDAKSMLLVRPTIVVAHQPLPPVEASESVVRGRHLMSADSSLMNGRRCRVGWSAGHTLMYSCTDRTNDTLIKNPTIFQSAPSEKSPYCLRVARLRCHQSTDDELVQTHLETALRHCQHIRLSDGATGILPLIAPLRDTPQIVKDYANTDQLLDNLSEGGSRILSNDGVWSLVDALWGQLEDDVASADDDYATRVARKDMMARWLCRVTNSEIEAQVSAAAGKDDGHLDAIFSLLSGRRIADACQMACDHREYRLALLISQASGDQHARHLVRKQLSEWEEQKVDQFINDDRLKVFTLLSGLMVWRSSQSTINVCHDVSWRLALALHQWYYCSSTASIEDAVTAYRLAFKGCAQFEPYASFPRPCYEGDSREGHSATPYTTYDVRYLLLCLYCDRSQSLETLLSPLMSSNDPLDWHMSWHLQQVLESLHYDQLGAAAHDQIQFSYASQLETAGLWHWACFVAMHHKDQSRRERAVKDIICRNCVSSADTTELNDEELFVVDQLHVPSSWIHEAKAAHSRSNNYQQSTAVHLMEAGLWNEAHSLIISSLAPDHIINGESERLAGLLERLSPPERCCSINNWSTGGKVYLDYILLERRLRDIEAGRSIVTGYELEELEVELSSLVTRINRIEADTPRHRLCQSEIAKHSSDLLKVVLKEMATVASEATNHGDSAEATWSSAKLANHLTQLPLPPDYCLRELKDLVRNYTMEVTSSMATTRQTELI